MEKNILGLIGVEEKIYDIRAFVCVFQFNELNFFKSSRKAFIFVKYLINMNIQ